MSKNWEKIDKGYGVEVKGENGEQLGWFGDNSASTSNGNFSSDFRKNANLFFHAPEMLEMLKELAKIKEPMAYPTYCPFCDKEFDTDHDEDCKLGKLLKEVEG